VKSRLYWLRTVFVLIPVVAFLTIVGATVTVTASLFDSSGRLAHWLTRWWWARGILAVTGVRVRVTGLDALGPGETYVFVANHQSFYDIPVLFWWLPYQVRIIAKESLGSVPFLGWHLRRTGHVLVNRSKPDRVAILRCWRDLVSKGLSLLVFPEGTRSPDGRVGWFKGGSFMMALEARLPLVPLSLVGTRAIMPKGRLTAIPGDVELVVHPPIVARARAEKPTIDEARALAAEVREIISARVEALERERGTWPSE
jgi:1-acyl-sn-glycerol-3-phosphate acyltransferase